MGEIERRNRRLPDIGVDVSRQAAEPGIHRVDGFRHGCEVAALDDLFNETQFLVGGARVGIPDSDRRGHVSDAGIVGAQFLKRQVGIGRLVRRISVDLLQDCGDGFSLREPLPPDLSEQFRRVGLVEKDGPRRPAIGEGQSVQLVQEPRRRRRREANDGEHAQVLRAKAGFEAAGQSLIGEQSVEINRGLWNANAMALCRDAGMQIGERLGIIEPRAFWHERLNEADEPVGAIDEAKHDLVRVNALVGTAFIEPGLGAGCVLRRRQIGEGQEVAGFKMRAGFFEVCPSLCFDQR